jgi:hypothetical protein
MADRLTVEQMPAGQVARTIAGLMELGRMEQLMVVEVAVAGLDLS